MLYFVFDFGDFLSFSLPGSDGTLPVLLSLSCFSVLSGIVFKPINLAGKRVMDCFFRFQLLGASLPAYEEILTLLRFGPFSGCGATLIQGCLLHFEFVS